MSDQRSHKRPYSVLGRRGLWNKRGITCREMVREGAVDISSGPGTDGPRFGGAVSGFLPGRCFRDETYGQSSC